ncbi:MAG: hypothetical protein IT579_24410 [Verrucomicrobia subdivision 3 bacterium]|nr:hypothetical protein [Limisphaerales bacterium]
MSCFLYFIDESATAGEDYESLAGTLIFQPGETSRTFSVPIHDDGAPENTETIGLRLLNPVRARLGMRQARIAIVGN